MGVDVNTAQRVYSLLSDRNVLLWYNLSGAIHVVASIQHWNGEAIKGTTWKSFLLICNVYRVVSQINRRIQWFLFDLNGYLSLRNEVKYIYVAMFYLIIIITDLPTIHGFIDALSPFWLGYSIRWLLSIVVAQHSVNMKNRWYKSQGQKRWMEYDSVLLNEGARVSSMHNRGNCDS